MRPLIAACLIVLALVCLTPAGIAEDKEDRAALLAAFRAGRQFKYEGRLSAAIPEYEKAVTLAKKVWGEKNGNTATLCEELGKLYLEMGLYNQATVYLRESARLVELVLGPDHPRLAASLESLATAYFHSGQYARVEPLYQRALQIRTARHGKDHLDIAETLASLAAFHQALGNYDRAEPLFQRALEIREAKAGPDRPSTAQALNDLARLYTLRGDYDRAEPLFVRSLKIRKSAFDVGEDIIYLPHVAAAQQNLARVYRARGRDAEALALLKDSLETVETKLGKTHPDVAVRLNELARLYLADGKPGEAEPLVKRGLAIWSNWAGLHHIPRAEMEQTNALLHLARSRWVEAGQAFDDTSHTLRQFGHRVLPVLAESEQIAFLHNRQEPSLHLALSLALARPEDSALATHSAEWSLNAKAVGVQALAERYLLARGQNDRALAGTLTELFEVRSRLSALSLRSLEGRNTQAMREQLTDLAKREEELSRRLGQAIGRPVRDPWYRLDEVRKGLPAGSVFLDVVRVHVRNVRAADPLAQAGEMRYAVWVVPARGEGEVRVMDLGPAETMDELIRSYRVAMRQTWLSIFQKDDEGAEALIRKELERIADRTLAVVRPAFGKAERLLISPDASLWLVPWAALPLPEGGYALEKYRISYLTSGRDLASPSTSRAAGPALVMGNPDYDLRPAVEGGKRMIPRAEGAGFPVHFPPLPGTAREAAAVKPLLDRWLKKEVVLLTGEKAVERAFKAIRQPCVVVLCTHGYFLKDQRGPSVRAAGNPLLRCGLAFSGANQRALLPEDAADDGLLTGLEIVGTDLRGTELVVLSACETGLGEVQNGEGVVGLRQAFQLAGVRSVVATLWKVKDEESWLLMETFWGELAAGRAKVDALRNAQLQFIELSRKTKKAAHPYFWAAFTLTGEWN
jgi:CHAT domain-containing protein/tetratricopeptide (TPR) repeat protein